VITKPHVPSELVTDGQFLETAQNNFLFSHIFPYFFAHCFVPKQKFKPTEDAFQ